VTARPESPPSRVASAAIDPRLLARDDGGRRGPPIVNLVVPCYNEEAVLHATATRLVAMLDALRAGKQIADASSVYFVDDGSRDRTWQIIEELAGSRTDVCGIRLSRNRGHQNALLCGLMSVGGDAVISLDADLQDDVDVIPKMVEAFVQGDEIVYAVRRSRAADTAAKRLSAESYYRLLGAMGVPVVFNHGDYRLLGRRALEALREYPETHLFLRGMIPQLGFRSSRVEFDRAERLAGESKYPLRKMLSLAWQGITSFSAAPLRIVTGAGVLVSLSAIGLALWALYIRLAGQAVPGWASIVVPLYFLGGIQLLGLGIIGEYLAKVYEAGKQRPRYHVEAVVGAWRG